MTEGEGWKRRNERGEEGMLGNEGRREGVGRGGARRRKEGWQAMKGGGREEEEKVRTLKRYDWQALNRLITFSRPRHSRPPSAPRGITRLLCRTQNHFNLLHVGHDTGASTAHMPSPFIFDRTQPAKKSSPIKECYHFPFCPLKF